MTGQEIEPVGQAPAVAPRNLAEWVAELDRRREVLVAEGDHVGLIQAGVQIQAFGSDLKILLDQLKLDLAVLVDAVGEQHGSCTTLEVPGLGVVEVQGSYTHKDWESEKLLRLLLEHAVDGWLSAIAVGVQQALEDEDGAEPGLCRKDLIDGLMFQLKACLPLTGSLQWRLKELLKRGIDPDDYHDKTLNPRKAKLPK